MITIDKKQMQDINGVILLQFFEKIIAFLKENLPEYVNGYPEFILNKFVKNGVFLAKKNEFNTEFGITLFVVFMFISAPNFFEYEKIKNIFKRYENDDDRIELIGKILTEKDWNIIKKNYKDQYWD